LVYSAAIISKLPSFLTRSTYNLIWLMQEKKYR
jgi:hypothetical protein